MNGKPRIGLVTDTAGWAFANIARQLQRHLTSRFDFTVLPMDALDNDITQTLLLTRDCDLVHFFWREHLRLIGAPEARAHVERLGLTYDAFEARYVRARKITTGIYDHLLLTPAALAARAPLYRDLLAGYSVASRKLLACYAAAPGYPAPSAVLEDGVDLALFQPRHLERLGEIPGREMVIGWVGNSAWAADIADFKGVHTLLNPAIARLRAEGYPVVPHFADRQAGFIPHAEMPDYYAKIDLYVCMSKIEGTPNPILEAMACGVPIVTTDVGIVPEAFGPLQRQFVLETRALDALVEKLKTLLRTPTLLQDLSAENRAAIAPWDWRLKALPFGDFFDAMLKAAVPA